MAGKDEIGYIGNRLQLLYSVAWGNREWSGGERGGGGAERGTILSCIVTFTFTHTVIMSAYSPSSIMFHYFLVESPFQMV